MNPRSTRTWSPALVSCSQPAISPELFYDISLFREWATRRAAGCLQLPESPWAIRLLIKVAARSAERPARLTYRCVRPTTCPCSQGSRLSFELHGRCELWGLCLLLRLVLRVLLLRGQPIGIVMRHPDHLVRGPQRRFGHNGSLRALLELPGWILYPSRVR